MNQYHWGAAAYSETIKQETQIDPDKIPIHGQAYTLFIYLGAIYSV